MSRRLGVTLRIAGVLLVGVLVYVLAQKVDWAALVRALRHAELAPLVLASALFFLTLLGKAIVWRILLAPAHVVPVRRLFRYTIAAFAGSVLAPARAGEVLRVLALKQRDGVPAADSTGVMVTDKLLHTVTLLVLAAPLPLLLPRLPAWVGDTLLVTASVAMGVLVASYIAVGRVEARHPQRWFGRFLAGMHAVRDPARLVGAFAVIALVWFVDLLSIMAVLRALDIEMSLAGGLFILFSVNLAIAVPATPGNVGTLQLGAIVAARLLGVPGEPALALALLYHVIQVVPLLVVGAALEFRLVIPGGARGKLAT